MDTSGTTIKWFKSLFSCVIFPLPQPQVANQKKQDRIISILTLISH